jgi:ribulose-5-phosphate 4-epimerase/fuculose-1-phosphate aldolase
VLKGHSNLIVGESIEETCISALWAEKAAALQFKAMMLGEPDWFARDVAHRVRDQVIAGKAYLRAWNYYAWRIGNK